MSDIPTDAFGDEPSSFVGCIRYLTVNKEKLMLNENGDYTIYGQAKLPIFYILV